MSLNRNLPPVPITTFSMVPKSDVPRSTFKTTSGYKTTFDAAILVPFFVEEVLPGDHMKGKIQLFCRMATPLWPIMDNLYLETFFFFVPNRITWTNWVKFMGEQDSPGDSISFTIPTVTAGAASGFLAQGLGDYFGLPVVGNGQVTVAPVVNALPFRAYNIIYNEWFRDENLVNPTTEYTGDANQAEATYAIRRRAKRPDYFTSALPWPLKGGGSVTIPLLGQANVFPSASRLLTGSQNPMQLYAAVGGLAPAVNQQLSTGAASQLAYTATAAGASSGNLYIGNLYADLSTATGATINSMRLAVATQQFLEKDARGGTRYAELLRMHFGVTPQDARLQRPEYIGGGSNMFNTQAIPQTANTTPATTPVGTLMGATVGSGRHSFSYAASEHGFIIGILNVRADITYQQGIHRMWTRSTRYDYYWPTFAFLGEQAIRRDEIFATGVVATDTAAFGYQERWAEYRYRPSRITGKFRSFPTAGTLDAWHLAEAFAANPTLNNVFIEDVTDANVRRAVAAGALANGQQFLLDSVIMLTATRPIPTRSVPGLTRF